MDNAPELQPLDPAIRNVWRLQMALSLGVAFLIAVIVDLARFINDSAGFPQPFILSALLLVVFAALLAFVPSYRYRYWRYALLPGELYLERGNIVRVRTVVPLRRIQHLDVSQNLFEREFNVSKLIVHTAGAQSGDIILPGLQSEEAERLRDVVKTLILQDVDA